MIQIDANHLAKFNSLLSSFLKNATIYSGRLSCYPLIPLGYEWLFLGMLFAPFFMKEGEVPTQTHFFKRLKVQILAAFFLFPKVWLSGDLFLTNPVASWRVRETIIFLLYKEGVKPNTSELYLEIKYG